MVNNKAPSVEPPIGHCCCDSRQYDRLTTTGWALHFRPPTISIMSVLMYTEQPQSQGHGQGKHTCRKQTSDRIIKCHDWFSLLCARSVYCVGGVVPDFGGFLWFLLWFRSSTNTGGMILCKCYDLFQMLYCEMFFSLDIYLYVLIIYFKTTEVKVIQIQLKFLNPKYVDYHMWYTKASKIWVEKVKILAYFLAKWLKQSLMYNEAPYIPPLYLTYK